MLLLKRVVQFVILSLAACYYGPVQEKYIVQADRLGCDIITVPPQIISKLNNLSKSAEEISLDTVRAFQKDISELGFSILE